MSHVQKMGVFSLCPAARLWQASLYPCVEHRLDRLHADFSSSIRLALPPSLRLEPPCSDAKMAVRGVADFEATQYRRDSSPYHISAADIAENNDKLQREPSKTGNAWGSPSPGIKSPIWDDHGGSTGSDVITITRSATRGASRTAAMNTGRVDFGALSQAQSEYSRDERATAVADNFAMFCEELTELVDQPYTQLDEAFGRFYTVRELTSKVQLSDLQSTLDVDGIIEKGRYQVTPLSPSLPLLPLHPLGGQHIRRSG
jgi:hypothetical protein